jgi:hypothetical protein
MKNDLGDEDTRSESDKKPGTRLRRAGHVGLAILNPFSDLAVIYHRGVKPTLGRFQQAWALLNRHSAPSESLDWAEAVARTGRTVEQLQTNFARIRIAWWCLMMITGGLATLLAAMLVFAHDLPSGTLLRAVMATVLLASLSAVGFVKTLISTYRLWQLQGRRVSESEGGTFKDFLAQNHWVRQVVTLGPSR